MAKDVLYDCKCGYSYIETIGYAAGNAAAFIIYVSQLSSCCKSCGFAQRFVSDEYVFEMISLEIDRVGGVEAAKKIINKACKENNKNRCNKCNAEMEVFKDANNQPILWLNSSYRRMEAAKTLECTKCKEFRQVKPPYKEYYLDVNTKEVIKEDEIIETTCGVCNSEMRELQTNEVLKLELNNEERNFRYATLVKCPKCKKFDIEEDEVQWD